MVSKKLVIENEAGLHMRPAGVLSKEMENFDCTVSILYGDKRLNAKSLINILSANIKQGSEVIFECDGEDEEEALAKIDEIASQGFGAIYEE